MIILRKQKENQMRHGEETKEHVSYLLGSGKYFSSRNATVFARRMGVPSGMRWPAILRLGVVHSLATKEAILAWRWLSLRKAFKYLYKIYNYWNWVD